MTLVEHANLGTGQAAVDVLLVHVLAHVRRVQAPQEYTDRQSQVDEPLDLLLNDLPLRTVSAELLPPVGNYE